jgi:hypothetical protein
MYQPEKSTVEEHNNNHAHHIPLKIASIMARKARFLDQCICKVIKNNIHPKNMNQEDDFSLSRMWKPRIHFLKKKRHQTASKNLIVLPSSCSTTLAVPK